MPIYNKKTQVADFRVLVPGCFKKKQQPVTRNQQQEFRAP
jgi:hypothetical protein